MSYQVYNCLIKTNIDYIESIPDHWIIKPFKLISYMKGRIGWQNLRSSEFTFNEDEPYLITGMNFKNGKINWNEVYHISEERYSEAPEIQLKQNDVLITKDGTIGKVLFVDSLPGKASLNSHLLVLRPLKNSYFPKYLYFLLSSTVFQNYVEIAKTGTTFYGITQEAVGNFKMILPSYTEQECISDFLDQETSRIDALIEQKQEFIRLLNEKRASLIYHAVTKGLNPKVKLKHSDISWLGDVPEHWETWKISHGFNLIGSGTTPKTDETDFYDGDIPWITTSELRENIISESKKYLTEKALDEHSALKLYPKGTLLIAMYGATIGRLGILDIEATLNQACCAFAKPTVFDTKFVFYWLWMSRPVLISLSSGGGQPNLSQELLKQIKIPVPSVEEQKAIADYLDIETVKLDNLVSEVEKAIEKLYEYRTALITAAVTGKINVSNQ